MESKLNKIFRKGFAIFAIAMLVFVSLGGLALSVSDVGHETMSGMSEMVLGIGDCEAGACEHQSPACASHCLIASAGPTLSGFISPPSVYLLVIAAVIGLFFFLFLQFPEQIFRQPRLAYCYSNAARILTIMKRE